MGKRFLYLLGILLTIIIGTYFSWKLCCEENYVDNTSTIIEESSTQNNYQPPTLYAFTVQDENGSTLLEANDHFKFERSELNFLTPVSSNLDLSIDQLKELLLANNKFISITGYYLENENNNSAFPNLGLARANSVKNYFNSKGIPSKIINTYGDKKPEMVADSLHVFHGPIGFQIIPAKDNTEDLVVLETQIKEHPIILHFKTGQANINLTAAERQEIADISKYLDKVDGAVCMITGHTDNTGTPEQNIALGLERANSIKQYLIRNAIPVEKIEVFSKGQQEPIADNATTEGKAQNRRTVITIK
ncbi:OmpA family protein [Tenacibaculum amylolyticum]|uniref:OmpA family protein n=1 Tax=Tenacibaculum amylolyticum TaxID=104269 RepID=UPI0038936A47